MADNSAFERLFRRHYTELCIFAKRFALSDEACEDVVSDAFEDLWRSYDELEPTALRAYLYKNVRNKCIDYLRRVDTRRQHAELYARLTAGYDSADHLAEEHERERIVAHVLSTLPDYTRMIFTACYVDRKQYREVAEQLNISASTVKKYVSKALAQIALLRKNAKKTSESVPEKVRNTL